jgi:hypothetical protein
LALPAALASPVVGLVGLFFTTSDLGREWHSPEVCEQEKQVFGLHPMMLHLPSGQGEVSLQQPAVREHAFKTSPIGASAAAGLGRTVPAIVTTAAKTIAPIHDLISLNMIVS